MSRLTFLVLFVFPLSWGHIQQYSPGSEEILRGLEQFAEAAKRQLADKPIPDMSHWKMQRIETINTLKELRSKLDFACSCANHAKVLGSGMNLLCTLSTLIEFLMGFLPLPFMNVSSYMCPLAFLTTQTSSIMELILSTKYQNDLQATLIKDREISSSLEEWLQFSRNLEGEVQNIFGFDLKSKNTLHFALLNEFYGLLTRIENFKEALDLMKRGKYSIFLENDIYIDDLLKFSKYLKDSPLDSKKIQLSLTILSTLISFTKSAFEVYRNMRQEKMSETILSIWNKLNIKIPPAVKSSALIFLNVLDLAREVTSFQNARNIVKDGNCPYSDSLKHIIDILEQELTFMESSFSI
ncbi:hypothetical protein AVEN_174410-1 [Araneus ventricosus]|uniref:Uncharacterized protein n=1 Tax=Araneus ventricosus TaxID=182803 RepID=A0A4Y2H3A6_ARAVE|nr:hypothetical protein AVEN_174410-1 [Araneus ventricosus]